MKKIYLLLVFLLIGFLAGAQTTYPAYKMSLLGHLDPESADAGDGRNYSGCWGWYQASKNKEYAIVGSSKKTYFIDITNPYNPVIKDSVMGRSGPCTWRELKTYQNYCYVASDVCSPNSFQIIDMQYLPDSVHVVYDDTTYFERAHTLWIDNNKLYAGGFSPTGSGAINMRVYSLSNPAAPSLLRTLRDDYPSITYIHDMFVRNDTVYASAGWQGLYVFKLTASNTFTMLGSLTTYPESGYNHSSFLTSNGKSLVFCDEAPAGLSIKVADVSNLSNITLPALTKPNSSSMFVAHNPYIKGDKWAFVSCYQDGLLLYDISMPSNPILKGFFDTYPQGGSNTGNYNGSSYRGNWGCYPYFPSGVILACDMQNGIFLLESNSLLGTTIGIDEHSSSELQVGVYPNPASETINISLINPVSKSFKIEITDILGKSIYSEENLNDCSFPVTFKNVDVSSLTSGSYFVKISAEGTEVTKKIIIAK